MRLPGFFLRKKQKLRKWINCGTVISAKETKISKMGFLTWTADGILVQRSLATETIFESIPKEAKVVMPNNPDLD